MIDIITGIKLPIFMILVIVTGSIEHICIPLLVTYYQSLLFITLMIALQGCLNFFILFLIVTKGKIFIPKEKKSVIIAGILNAFMSMSFIYSANPERTPIIIQSIFLGLAVFPTVIFRKLLLNKQIKYERVFLIPSIICLFLSVFFSVLPVFNASSGFSRWIGLYVMAIILLASDNVMQERYIYITNDNTFTNKIALAFYTSLVQIFVLIAMSWIEIPFGYNSDPFKIFYQSVITYFTSAKTTFLLQLFIYDCLFLYVASIYLNQISSNYNMILTNLTNQSVAIFFLIFPELNKGIEHTWGVTILSILFSLTGIILWIKSEKEVHEEIA